MPSTTSQTLKLTYPIFGAEFDPYDRGYLVVCGGGGENRTGVPNKLTLLDVSSRRSISEVADISLSTDEDSPQSIASLVNKQGLITLAGISSSVDDQTAGKNEHLRSFDVEFPPRKRVRKGSNSNEKTQGETGVRIQWAGQSALFKPPTVKTPRTYQRVMRLSPVGSREVAAKRIGAIASADAAENEIVLFDATTFIPRPTSILQRVPLQGEAEDLDLCEYKEGFFGLAYCMSREVYLYRLTCNFATKTSTPDTDQPILIHSIIRQASGPTSKIRSLRWLSAQHILLLINNQPGGAPELVILQVDPAGNSSSKVVQRKSLPKKMSIGVRLAVCSLDADPASGKRQIVIAVAGQDLSIHLFTIDFLPNSPAPQDSLLDAEVSPFKKFSVIDASSQHDQGISALAFSTFYPPRQPADSTTSVASDTQYIRLVSTSLGYTVSVETFALTSTPTPPSDTVSDPVAQEKARLSSRPSVRWVLSSPQNEFIPTGLGIFFAGIAIFIVALLIQNYLIAPSNMGSNIAPFSNANSAVDDLGSSAAAMASASLSSGSSDASSLLESIGSTVASAGSSAADGASTALSSGSSAVSSLADSLASTASDAGIDASSSLSSGIDPLSSLLSSGSSAASSAASTASSSAMDLPHRLADLLHHHRHALSTSVSSAASSASSAVSDSTQAAQKALHISTHENPYSSDLSASLHENAEELRQKGAKTFAELSEPDKKVWKERLVKAGRWTESEGTTVLMGVLFSEYASVVGGALKDAVLGS